MGPWTVLKISPSLARQLHRRVPFFLWNYIDIALALVPMTNRHEHEISPADWVKRHQNRLDELSPRHAWVLRGHYIHGKGPTQLANEQGIKKQSIAGLLKSAVVALQNLLQGNESLLSWVQKHKHHLGELKESYAWVLRSRYIQGRSQKELAKEKGVAPNTISALEKRAVAALKELLEPTGRKKFVRDHRDKLDDLKESYAWVLRSHFLKGKSWQELARERGGTEGAMASLADRAFLVLKQRVEVRNPRRYVQDHQHRLAELPDNYAWVLRGRYLEKKTPQELADEKGITSSPLSQLEKRALVALIELIQSGNIPTRKLVRDNQHRLAELKPGHAWVLRGRYLEGKTQPTLADESGTTQPSVAGLEARALANLRKLVMSSRARKTIQILLIVFALPALISAQASLPNLTEFQQMKLDSQTSLIKRTLEWLLSSDPFKKRIALAAAREWDDIRILSELIAITEDRSRNATERQLAATTAFELLGRTREFGNALPSPRLINLLVHTYEKNSYDEVVASSALALAELAQEGFEEERISQILRNGLERGTALQITAGMEALDVLEVPDWIALALNRLTRKGDSEATRAIKLLRERVNRPGRLGDVIRPVIIDILEKVSPEKPIAHRFKEDRNSPALLTAA